MLKPGTLWRHNVAGDLPGKGDRISRRKLFDLVHAAGHTRGFTFTHKPLTKTNASAIRRANQLGGLVINLSSDDLHDADRKASAEVGPVAVVLPSDAPDKGNVTPEGRPIVVCPAQLRDNITCKTCGLCAVGARKSIVAFRAHGRWKRRVNERLRHLPVVN